MGIAAVTLAVAAPAAGVTVAACHRSPPPHVGSGGGDVGLTTAIPYTLVYRVPASSPLAAESTEGLENFAALAVARHKMLITVSTAPGGSKPCDSSSVAAVVVDSLRSSLRTLHSSIRVTTTGSGSSSTVTVTS